MTHGGATLRPSRVPSLAELRAYDAVGVGHVPVDRGTTRHPCGESVRAERFAWPAKSRCIECIEKVGIVVPRPVAAETELETRAAWGDK